MRLLAPAKINLHLRVGPPRADGFHPLLTWMSTIGLFDTLEISALSPPHASLAFSCDDPGLEGGAKNLVVAAADALARRVIQARPSLPDSRSAALRLSKRIPIGGGLGGGSSDAARTLMGLNRLWGLHWPPAHLADVAAMLGSDVPFFLHGASSVCTGRGENVRPIARPTPRWAMLILPAFSMPTPSVYKRFDAMALGRQEDIEREPDWQAWTRLSAFELLPTLVNDLEPPAFDLAPALGNLRADYEQRLGRIVRMSGSGSTLFTLFDTQAQAETVAAALRRGAAPTTIVELAPDVIDDLCKIGAEKSGSSETIS